MTIRKFLTGALTIIGCTVFAVYLIGRQNYSAEYRADLDARKIACPPTMAPVDCLRADKPDKRRKPR